MEDKRIFNIVLKEFGITRTVEGNGLCVSTKAKSTDEHIEILAGLASLNARIFKLTLMLESALTQSQDPNNTLFTSKRFYDHAADLMSKQFEQHMEILVDDGLTVSKKVH